MKQDRFFRQWLLLALILLALGLAVAFDLIRERGRVQVREQERLLDQTRIIEENLERQLRTVADVLAGLRDEMGGEGALPSAGRLQTLSDAMPGVRTLLVADAEGAVLVANHPELVGRNFASRDYFARMQHDPALETLFVLPPFEAVPGVYAIHLTRVIPGPAAEFAGIVSATLAPDYFSTLLDSVRYAPDMWTAIAHGDGLRFLMVPPPGSMAAMDLARPGSFFSRHMASGRESTVFSGTIYATGEERLLAQRTVHPGDLGMDKPLVVTVSRDLRAVYSGWRRDFLIQGGLFILLVLVLASGLAVFQRRQRAFLRLAADHALILESVGEGIVSLDNGGRITYMNRAAEQISGWASPEIIGRDCHFLLKNICAGGNLCSSDACPLRATMVDGLVRSLEEGHIVRGDGRIVPVAVSVTPTRGREPAEGCVLLFRDITERKKLEAELRELATTDSLTSLPNRRYFLEQLDRELARLQRQGGTTALLMLDIDHFKQVNDTFGHAVGDEVLRHVASLLRTSLRRTDLAGRLGGEEFALMLPGMSEESAGLFAERLREQVAVSAVDTGRGAVRCTISIGRTFLAKNDRMPDAALSRADVALYRAKGNGRNRVETEPPPPEV